MKKIYYVGDMINNTGPAMVNKSYYPYLKDKMIFCFSNKKIIRTMHFLLNVLFVKNVIISGFSKLNLLFLKISKKLNKKTFYLMHGFIKEEMKYLDVDSKEEKINNEYTLLNLADNIICVSERFSEYLKKVYPEFKNKITFLNNGVDINIKKERIKHDKYTIISVGGGVRRKNNLKVCEAIDKNKIDVRFIVIGALQQDGKKIEDYQFVEYYESLSHDEVLNKMCESDLYIQNSYFETFGLAVMEALECGCDLLLSKNIGALSILENVSQNDIINNVDDKNEISTKIINKNKNKKNNNNYLHYNKLDCSCEQQCRKLLGMVR